MNNRIFVKKTVNKAKIIVKTIISLGFSNLCRIVFYRISIKLIFNKTRLPKSDIPKKDFFFESSLIHVSQFSIVRHCLEKYCYFGWYEVNDLKVPNWHCNPLTGANIEKPMRPWWEISDFDEGIGDIKAVWEASRFSWVLIFAQHVRSGHSEALKHLNTWLIDWVQHNPPYYGVNWKCGQEASIRVMHLAMAALILEQHQRTSSSLQALIKAHLQRIEPTIYYAVAQDNNHGTSEAAALFIGGSWLDSLGDNEGRRWLKKGRYWLENRAKRLIEEDGSFSQYSVNYHRVVLDTYSMAERWRLLLQLPKFSPLLYSRLSAASVWLYQMTQADTGDAPNLGANDGAHLLPLNDADYRDFRPSVQLAMSLFAKRCAYSGKGSWNIPLQWLSLPVPTRPAEPVKSIQFSQGGYSILRQEQAFALLRFPRFRFRPGQADALHVDLWVAGENLLRDAGTFSYNAGDEVTQYFGGTAGHNTVQFDDYDQMPRLSRFLFGDWLRAKQVIPVTEINDGVTAGASYTDRYGASHQRQLWLSKAMLRVEDQVTAFKHKAILRWRLSQGHWQIEDNSIYQGNYMIRVTTTVPIQRFELISGWESRYYLQRKVLPVLEIELHHPGTLITEYHFF